MAGFFGPPVLVASADQRLELFVTGLDENLWHIYQTTQSNGLSNWVSHGTAWGGFPSCPALTPSADGRLELFAVASDGVLWHIWQTAQSNVWPNWVSHGTPP
jgi:hypothetical protein